VDGAVAERINAEETQGPHRFQAGNPWRFQEGNAGRPKGSRNKLGEAFIDDLFADWLGHGTEVIAKVREDDPSVYLRVMASILPKELRLGPAQDLDDDELDRRIRQLASYIAMETGEGGVAGVAIGEAAPDQAQPAQPIPAIPETA